MSAQSEQLLAFVAKELRSMDEVRKIRFPRSVIPKEVPVQETHPDGFTEWISGSILLYCQPKVRKRRWACGVQTCHRQDTSNCGGKNNHTKNGVSARCQLCEAGKKSFPQDAEDTVQKIQWVCGHPGQGGESQQWHGKLMFLDYGELQPNWLGH